MKTCKFCAEDIKPNALKCIHCEEFQEAPAFYKQWWFIALAVIIALLFINLSMAQFN